MIKFFKKKGRKEKNVGLGLFLRDRPITRCCVGRLGKKSINNFPCHHQLGSDNVGWAFSPTMNFVLVETPTYFDFNAISYTSCKATRHVKGDLVPEFTQTEVFLPYYYSPRKVAFTLAEILITLGIIGVVAALTLPTLIQNYQKHVAVNRLKVNFNILSNAIRMAEAQYGNITEWDEVINGYNPDYMQDDDGKVQAKTQAGKIIKKYIMPYLNASELTETKTLAQLGYKTNIVFKNGSTFAKPSNSGSILRLKNGTTLLIDVASSVEYDGGKKALMGIKMVMDIDGANGANTIGNDVFMVTVPYAKDSRFMFLKNYVVNSTTKKLDIKSKTRADLLLNCKTYGEYCGAIIQMDGWQIKDDYPW